jgi:hypothetical protein
MSIQISIQPLFLISTSRIFLTLDKQYCNPSLLNSFDQASFIFN